MSGYPPQGQALPVQGQAPRSNTWKLVGIIAIVVAVIFFLILIGILIKFSTKKDCAKEFKDCKKASSSKDWGSNFTLQKD